MSSRINLLKKKLKQREKLFGGWISFPSPSIAEIFSYMNFDFIAIDMEHSVISLNEAQRIVAACQSNGIPCLPRPVSHSNDFFKPLLDSGADGFFISTVNNSEEGNKLIKMLKYPPEGERTYGVNRAQKYGLESVKYFNSWNDDSSIIFQIESLEGVNNIEKILDINGVDGIMIGPYDLSGSLGVPGQINHELVIEASNKVINACNKKGVSCGTQISETNKENINKIFNMGYNFVILSSDLFILSEWAKKTIKLIDSFK